MSGLKTGVRVVAGAAGVIVLGACVVSVYLTIQLSPEIRPWSWKTLDLALALLAAFAGVACLKAGVTGKGTRMEDLLGRIDRVSEAAARREEEGLERQRKALERQRPGLLQASDVK